MIALAGCTAPASESGEGDDGDPNGEAVEAVPELVEVEDPPDAVYVPTHREAMRTLEPIETGDLALAPMVSYPHPFWTVAGGRDEDSVQRVTPEEGHGVHMMFTAWDRETGIVLPVDDGAKLRLYRDGERIGSPLSPWTMISQEMGFHFGDNVSLPGDGTYTVEVELPPISTRTTGELEGRLTDRETASFEFVYDEAFREEVVGGVEYLDEEYWGERGALEPMDHGDHGHDDDHEHEEHEHDDGDDHHVPYSQLPPVDAYPGTLLLEPGGDRPDDTTELPRSGDAAFLATVLDAGTRLADGDDRYLLVSPRTPYNRVPLADATATATIERDGETVVDSPLEQTLDGEYGLHYGTAVADVRPADSVTIEIEAPPQVARHQGYETAFLEMPPIELEVPEES